MKHTGVAVVMALALTLSLFMAGVLIPRVQITVAGSSDILVRVLGGVTQLAAESAYRRADAYFHAGVTSEDLHSEVHQAARPDLPFMNLMRRLHGETAPKEHRHLEGDEQRELLPWFVAAVRLDPHHVDAWRDGAYWFYRTGNIRKAEEFISDGIRHNPRDYRLYMDRGILRFRMERWEDCAKDMREAHQLWERKSDESDLELRAIERYLRYAVAHPR